MRQSELITFIRTKNELYERLVKNVNFGVWGIVWMNGEFDIDDLREYIKVLDEIAQKQKEVEAE